MSKTFKQFIAENTSAELTRITDSLVVKKVRGGKYKVVKADEGGRFQMGEPLSSNELPYPDKDEHGEAVPHVQVRENHPKRGHTTFMYNVDRNPIRESEKHFVSYINGKVVQSTHRDFVVGQDIVPSDLERPNIHFEDRSKKGSGPGKIDNPDDAPPKKPGYFGRKSFGHK